MVEGFSSAFQGFPRAFQAPPRVFKCFPGPPKPFHGLLRTFRVLSANIASVEVEGGAIWYYNEEIAKYIGKVRT